MLDSADALSDNLSVLDSLSDSILIIEKDFTISTANRQFLNLCKYSKQDVIGKKCYDVLHQCPAPCADTCIPPEQCCHEQVFQKGIPNTQEHRHRLADGSSRYFKVTASPVKENGAISKMLLVLKDITENKALKDSVLEINSELEKIFTSAPFFISYIDKDLRVLRMNPAMEELVGVSTEDAKKLHCYDIWGQYAHDKTKTGLKKKCDDCRVETALETGEKQRCERISGNRILEIISVPVRNREGNITGALEIGSDITERRNAEDSQRKFAHIVSATNDMISFIDNDYTIQAVNESCCRIHNRSRDDMLGRSVADIIGTERFNNFFKKHLDKALSGRKARFESWLEFPDNSSRYIEYNFYPYSDETGQVGTVISGRDMTDWKLSQDLIERAKQEWEKTFDSIKDILTVQDSEMHIVRANMATFEALGAGPDEIIGKHCYEVFRGIDKPCPECLAPVALEEFNSYSSEIRHERLNKVFQVSGSPILDDDGKIIGITHYAKDITDHKKLENQLRQAQKMEAIGTLAGGIAHDFNNILTSILGYTSIAMDELQKNTPIYKDLSEVKTAGKRAAELVKQILSFSRAGEQEFYPILISPVVKEALKLLRASMPTSISIKTDIASDISPVEGDPTQIHQVLMNLCTNAAHAMADTGGELDIILHQEEIDEAMASKVVGLKPGRYARLSVSDNGTGIPQDIMDKIFDPYYTTKDKGKGTGLGLAVVHGIVTNHSGAIQVSSTLGKGTRFDVFLPVANKEPVHQATQEEILEAQIKAHILCIDDEPQIALLISRTLQALGYEATSMTDPREALAYFEKHSHEIDLVLTDMTMPGITGEKLAELMYQIKPGIPMILCTGYSEKINQEKAYALGFKAFMMKPLAKNKLAKTIHEILSDQTSIKR